MPAPPAAVRLLGGFQVLRQDAECGAPVAGRRRDPGSRCWACRSGPRSRRPYGHSRGNLGWGSRAARTAACRMSHGRRLARRGRAWCPPGRLSPVSPGHGMAHTSLRARAVLAFLAARCGLMRRGVLAAGRWVVGSPSVRAGRWPEDGRAWARPPAVSLSEPPRGAGPRRPGRRCAMGAPGTRTWRRVRVRSRRWDGGRCVPRRAHANRRGSV